MPTKLKTPITVTINTVENAVNICAFGPKGNHERGLISLDDGGKADAHRIDSEIHSKLKDQGIDWQTWTPPKPFRIAGHEATFNPDGSIKVGCATVSSEEFKAAQDKRTEVMNAACGGCGIAAEPAEIWPRYWRASAGTIVEAKSVTHPGTWHNKTIDPYEDGGTSAMAGHAKREGWSEMHQRVALETIAAWAKARQPKEQTWPQYFKGHGGSAVLRFNNPDESGTVFEPGKMPRAWTGCTGSAYRLASSGSERGYKPMTIPEAEHMITNLRNK